MKMMIDYVFKIFSPSGKTMLTWQFGDDRFIDSFHVNDNKIFFHYDIPIEFVNFSSNQRANDVFTQLVNAYRKGNSFHLPVDSKFF